MKICQSILLGITSVSIFGLAGIADSFGIFPLLTTGWYYKPTPTEQVFLGLILVKVLALRLVSVISPLSLGKRSINLRYENGTSGLYSDREYYKKTNTISQQEFAVIERILLSLRRIDKNDCFLKVICELNQDLLVGKSSIEEEQYLQVFRLRKKTGMKSARHLSVWDSYEEAVTLEAKNCTKRYNLCPLSRKELEFDVLLSEVN